MRVAVIGAGTMGNGIAQVFAQQGHAVRLIDVSAEALNKGLETIRGSLARLVKKETIKADEADKAVARIKVGSGLEDAADPLAQVRAVRSARSGDRGVHDPGHQHQLDLDH